MSTSNKVTVVARDLSKTYSIGKDGSTRNIFQRRRRLKVEAVKDVNFVAQSGESIGVLGRNGSGKSTLLRMIAGSEEPTSGEVLVSSAPTLLGVSAALQQDLSGFNNARLGLLAMGLDPEEVEELAPAVIEWADLEEAAVRPLSSYSSGMQARLKFGIATAVRREILLVDEALSTGDSTFAAKAKERMNSFLDEAGTVFIVSHAPGTIEKYCTRALWLHQGELIADGKTRLIAKSYRLWSKRIARGDLDGAERVIDNVKGWYKPTAILFDSEAAELLDHQDG